MKRRRNPYFNGARCQRTPQKARYLKAAFAWKVGARQVKKTGIPLFLYECECGGWHLSKRSRTGSTKIESRAASSLGRVDAVVAPEVVAELIAAAQARLVALEPDSITEQLFAQGLVHRPCGQGYKHEIIRISDGVVVDVRSAHESSEWLEQRTTRGVMVSNSREEE